MKLFTNSKSQYAYLLALALFVISIPMCINFVTNNDVDIKTLKSQNKMSTVPHARIRMSEDNHSQYYVNKRTDKSEGQEKHREQIIRDPVVKGSTHRELTGDYTSETQSAPIEQKVNWDYTKKTPYIGYTVLRDEDWLANIFPKSSQPLDQPR